MKVLFRLFAIYSLILTVVPSSVCHADIEDESYGTEKQINPQKLRPIQFTLATDMIGKSQIHNRYLWDHHVKYGQSSLNLDVACYYDPSYEEGALISGGWSRTKIDWNHNPYFAQKYFDVATLALSFFTGRCYGWFWQARAAINVSTMDFNLSHYADYDLLLWGRYPLYNWSGANFHLGILAQTGMKADRVYPIIGVDWQVTPSCQLNLIFPINISALYTFADFWTVGVSGRFFNTRFRVSGQDYNIHYQKAVIEYRSSGVEALVSYSDGDWVFGNLHAGYMVSGRIKISNQHHRYGRWFDLQGAPYVGGEAFVKF